MAPLCAKGCGFYGSVDQKNMCSKCFADDLNQELIANSVAQSLNVLEEIKNSVANSSSPEDHPTDPSDPTVTASGTNSLKSSGSTATTRTRCRCCNKKLGLLGFNCKCGLVFCGVHRFPEKHSCCVDFKAAGREGLAMQNPLCKADKMESRI